MAILTVRPELGRPELGAADAVQVGRTPAGAGRAAGTPGWWRRHRAGLFGLLAVLVLVGLVNAWNMQGWPGMINDDEGTYVSQAWAMIARGKLAHYTYWYDHPFLGWALIAGYAWLTDGFARASSAVLIGREFMLICTLASSAVIYLLARRLAFHRITALVTVLVFGLSPLAVYYHRMVFLDNIATGLMLAAFAVAASPRRSVNAAFGAGVFAAAAVLTKETIVVLLPSLVWLLIQHTQRRTRWWNVSVFGTTFAVLVAAYPIFAWLNNELLPGPGHVSLYEAVRWQLVGRAGSGSLLDPNSGTTGLMWLWLDIDPWLLVGGVVLIPIGLAASRLRPIALALLIQIVMMLREGYVPYPYVIALLPFAALLIGGVADLLRRPVSSRPGLRWAGWVPLVAMVAIGALLVGPAWGGRLSSQASVDGSADSRAATAWVTRNVPRDAVIVTDNYIWLDLTLDGYRRPVWLWKLDTDPAVMSALLPQGYASIDYIVMNPPTQSMIESLPTLRDGIAHSQPVATFGDLTVRRVEVGGPAGPGGRAAGPGGSRGA